MGSQPYAAQDESNGSVFVYTRAIDGTWVDQPQVLIASNPVNGDHFGEDVAISGDRILVGATEKGVFPLNEDGSCCNYDDTTSPQRGKVYIFVNNGGTWEEEGEPLLPDEDATDPRFHFGAYVALDGDTALIGHDSATGGMFWDEDTQSQGHANLIVYGFSRTSGGSWEQKVKLTPSSLRKDRSWYASNDFGRGVELKGNLALVEGNGWGGNAILFINWENVIAEPPFGKLLLNIRDENRRDDRLALGPNEFFLGASYRENENDTYQGRVNVIDNFSVFPVSLDCRLSSSILPSSFFYLTARPIPILTTARPRRTRC
jgi:hypothetical protein